MDVGLGELNGLVSVAPIDVDSFSLICGLSQHLLARCCCVVGVAVLGSWLGAAGCLVVE